MSFNRVFNNILMVFIALSISWYSTCFADNHTGNKIVRLATTTSTENSGLLRYLLPRFTEQTGYTSPCDCCGYWQGIAYGQGWGC